GLNGSGSVVFFYFDWVGNSGWSFIPFTKDNKSGKGEIMFRQILPQEQVQPLVVQAPLGQITAQSFTTVISVIMVVWTGTFVLSQVIKVVKGEEVEKPPILLVK
ncbi:unnamed protein product, partial [marine sediment metagenome]